LQTWQQVAKLPDAPNSADNSSDATIPCWILDSVRAEELDELDEEAPTNFSMWSMTAKESMQISKKDRTQ
jgi:hypothetical protein